MEALLSFPLLLELKYVWKWYLFLNINIEEVWKRIGIKDSADAPLVQTFGENIEWEIDKTDKDKGDLDGHMRRGKSRCTYHDQIGWVLLELLPTKRDQFNCDT